MSTVVASDERDNTVRRRHCGSAPLCIQRDRGSVLHVEVSGRAIHDKGCFPSRTKILGFVMTALAVSVGTPFWFDLLGRIVSLRISGARPIKAAERSTAAPAAGS